jgi:hypothetical protein
MFDGDACSYEYGADDNDYTFTYHDLNMPSWATSYCNLWATVQPAFTSSHINCPCYPFDWYDEDPDHSGPQADIFQQNLVPGFLRGRFSIYGKQYFFESLPTDTEYHDYYDANDVQLVTYDFSYLERLTEDGVPLFKWEHAYSFSGPYDNTSNSCARIGTCSQAFTASWLPMGAGTQRGFPYLPTTFLCSSFIPYSRFSSYTTVNVEWDSNWDYVDTSISPTEMHHYTMLLSDNKTSAIVALENIIKSKIDAFIADRVANSTNDWCFDNQFYPEGITIRGMAFFLAPYYIEDALIP